MVQVGGRPRRHGRVDHVELDEREGEGEDAAPGQAARGGGVGPGCDGHRFRPRVRDVRRERRGGGQDHEHRGGDAKPQRCVASAMSVPRTPPRVHAPWNVDMSGRP